MPLFGKWIHNSQMVIAKCFHSSKIFVSLFFTTALLKIDSLINFKNILNSLLSIYKKCWMLWLKTLRRGLRVI